MANIAEGQFEIQSSDRALLDDVAHRVVVRVRAVPRQRVRAVRVRLALPLAAAPAEVRAVPRPPALAPPQGEASRTKNEAEAHASSCPPVLSPT